MAIYLVHSLDDPDFERKDAEAARNFSAAAAAAGVKQIVYMGGLGDDDEDLSAHLRSRREVEELLGGDGVPVTVLRAAIVVGHGGISWELTRQLVKNLPAMVVPKWVGTRTQPIAIDDVVRYLAGVVDHHDALGRVFEIGGPDQLTYREMLQVAAEESERPRDPDRRGPAAHAAPVVVLAGAGHRRRRHDRAQPHRLDVHRGGRHATPRSATWCPGSRCPTASPCAARWPSGPPSSAGQKSRGSRNSIDSDHVMWVRIGARIPPLARRSRPQTVPSRTAAKASMTLPVASVATT